MGQRAEGGADHRCRPFSFERPRQAEQCPDAAGKIGTFGKSGEKSGGGDVVGARKLAGTPEVANGFRLRQA